MKPPRWSKPAPRTKVTVRGRRRRSVSGRSKESQDQSKESAQNGMSTKQRGAIGDTVSETKSTTRESNHDNGKDAKSREHPRSAVETSGGNRHVIGTRKKKSGNTGYLKAQESIFEGMPQDEKLELNNWSECITEATTHNGETNTRDQRIIDSLNRWSSISSKNSEFFLDNRKQLRKRKSTDKRYNMVVNIIKRHARLNYNRSEWYMQTVTRRTDRRPTTPTVDLSSGSTRKKRIITTLTYINTPGNK